MISQLRASPELVLIVVGAAGWIAFGIAIVIRPKPVADPAIPTAKPRRSLLSLVGILLQAIGFGCVYGFTRRFGQPLPPLSGLTARWIVTGFGGAITLTSAWLSIGAVRALGRQWSLQARVLSDHELITTGPFAIVRHPIYTALLGLCIVMGLALSTLPVLAVAIAFYFAGTAVRIRSEEALLREMFGARYTDYANYVPALIPRPRQP